MEERQNKMSCSMVVVLECFCVSAFDNVKSAEEVRILNALVTRDTQSSRSRSTLMQYGKARGDVSFIFQWD